METSENIQNPPPVQKIAATSTYTNQSVSPVSKPPSPSVSWNSGSAGSGHPAGNLGVKAEEDSFKTPARKPPKP